MMTDPVNGWERYKLDVLNRLADHTDRLVRIEEDIKKMTDRLGSVSGSTKVWSAIIAVILSVGATIVVQAIIRPPPELQSAPSAISQERLERLIQALERQQERNDRARGKEEGWP